MLPDLGPLGKKTACIWAVLQSHRLAHAFELVEYWGHPSVVKEMSLFMLTERVDPSEVGLISEQAKKVERAVADATSKVAKLKDTVASLKGGFSNLKDDFALVKKVKN
jgi:hypothetical protein